MKPLHANAIQQSRTRHLALMAATGPNTPEFNASRVRHSRLARWLVSTGRATVAEITALPIPSPYGNI